MKTLFLLVLVSITCHATSLTAGELTWIRFPDPRFEVNGLPWFNENKPELWRLPKTAKGKIPGGAWNRAVAPDGGRIRFKSSTAQLSIKVQAPEKNGKPCFLDVFTNDVYAGSAKIAGTNVLDLMLFAKGDASAKEITIYLPNNHQVHVSEIGISSGAAMEKPKPLSLQHPLVCYGSSVLQGTGAAHPSKTYPAILARRLNVDFVNLGFGGAGKAEPEVVDLVNKVEACGYLFDLGKSYGAQTSEPYVAMLKRIRAAHPNVPIFCVTPIYSVKEATEPGYREKSEDLRALMRRAALSQQQAGDTLIFVEEGLKLFGEADKELFNDPLHPNDEGNAAIADRLLPHLAKVLSRER